MKTERSNEILSQFAGKKILVVGDVILDHYVEGAVERINPEAPVPVLHARGEYSETGGAGNVAKNAASLGAKATLVSVVGADDAATQVEEIAKKEGYVCSLVSDKTRLTTKKTRFLVKGQQLLRVDEEEANLLTVDITKKIIKAVDNAVAKGVDGIIVSDYAKGVITPVLAKHLLKIAKKNSIPLAADVKPARIKDFSGATFIAPNIKEANEYLGKNVLENIDCKPEDLAKELKASFLTEVFLTLGPGGVFVLADKISAAVPQEHVIDVADTSGAGDTSVAVMMLAKLAGATPVEMAELANAAGAVVVSKIGAVSVSVHELEAMLSSRGTSSKMITANQARVLAEKLKAQGKIVITCNGSFDLLHAGHLDQFSQAKAQGDVLFVGLNTDEVIKAKKGHDRPLLDMSARQAMLAALVDVDYVVAIDGDYDAEPMQTLLPNIKPHVHVNGPDRGQPETWVEWPLMLELGIEGFTVEKKTDHSTTKLIEKIKLPNE